MQAELRRASSYLAVVLALLAFAAAGCGGGERPVRIGLLTDCRGLFSGLEEAMLAGAELPLLRRGGHLEGGKPVGGVTGARVSGREIELVRGCTETGEHTILVEEARRLVEAEEVDAVVGPIGPGDSLVVRELARKYPDVPFLPAWSGAQELTLRTPAPNVYRFDHDFAQDVAGLAAHAFRRLGWRRAVVIADPVPLGWQEEAGFVAEFCALGGRVTTRLAQPVDLSDPAVARAVEDADGVAVFISGIFGVPDPGAIARLVRSPATRVVVGPYVLGVPDMLRSVAGEFEGVIGASSIPPAGSTLAMRQYRRAFTSVYPSLPPEFAEEVGVLAFHDTMEGLLRALEAAKGDVSDRRRRLHEELGRVRVEVPGGSVRLDRNRQAVRPSYVQQIVLDADGAPGLRTVRVVPEVEQTFGGLLGEAPPPGPGTQPCRRGSPPVWAR